MVLGELLSSNGEGDGEDGGHGDGDTSNQENENVVESTSVVVSESGVEDEDFEDDEDTDGDETEETDLGENLLEMTSRIVVGSNESSGSTEEGVGSGSDDDTLGFSLLADGRGEALISDVLVLRERFSGETSLIDRDVDGVVESAIGGDDISNLERDDISGNEVGGIDFVPLSVSSTFGLGRERLHEGLDSVTGGSLLVESNGGVGEEEQDDTDEIRPIRRETFSVRKGDSDQRRSLHDPRERVPHEAASARKKVS